ILYSVADLHHVRLARQAAIEQRPELMAESRRLRLIECTAAWAADAVITHSRDEAALLRQAGPDAKGHVVAWHGPRPPETVPFRRVRLTVAPLRYGAGVKGKVLDSLAAGVPCVMSPIAAEGIALPPTLQDLIGQDAAQLASRILQLHSDAAENRAAAEAGLAL